MMNLTRREFGKLALTAIPATSVLTVPTGAHAQERKPNSLINGVQIGTITYSYRSMPDQSAEATLRYIVDSGISAIELMNGPAESFAGAPSAGRGGGGGGRGQALTPEQEAAQRAAAEQLKHWRTSVSMDRFKALRRMYNDAGVTIYAWKVLTPEMSDEEFEYVFDVAEALGCTHTTLELPTDTAQLKRIGQFAEKRKIYAAYHTHTQATMTSFDQAFALSKGTCRTSISATTWPGPVRARSRFCASITPASRVFTSRIAPRRRMARRTCHGAPATRHSSRSSS
jgi:hypothetical protein